MMFWSDATISSLRLCRLELILRKTMHYRDHGIEKIFLNKMVPQTKRYQPDRYD